MELDTAIKGRRSIRKYQNKDVPDHIIEELLDLACHAPSSMNGQPWHFIVVKNSDIKKRLAAIKNKYCPVEKQIYEADFLVNAPVLIVVCVDKHKSYNREIENGVLATANIMLGAYSRGLGSVYMSAYRTNEPKISTEVMHLLNIPEYITPITIIPFGYPNEIPESKELPLLAEISHYEKF